MISTFTALIDANVFYGARLRSLMLYLAKTGTFRARWTDEIHDEWIRNLIKRRPDLTPADLAVTRTQMNRAVPDCLVTGYEALIPSLELPDPGDRHVLAAAIEGGADIIVTFNVKDFPKEKTDPHGIHVKHPDDFLLDLESLHSSAVLQAVSEDLLHYDHMTVEAYIDDLRKAGVVDFAKFLDRIRIAIEAEQTELPEPESQKKPATPLATPSQGGQSEGS